MVFEKICKALSEQLEVDVNTISMDTSIVDDLGADSLDVVELMMFIEDEYGITVPDEELHNFHTVGDVADYVEKHQGK